MFEAFDMIRIISLPQRQDRRAEMARELARAGLAGDPRVAFFDALRPSGPGHFSSIGAHGCYLSHLGALEEAVAASASILIIEDDCDIVPGASVDALETEWDIFYGGYIPANPDRLEDSDIVGSHMMGFSRDGAVRVLEYLRTIEIADVQHPPIDAAYIWFRRSNPDVKTVFASPPIGHQRPSRSDIEPGAFYNRAPVLRDLIELARRARRALRQSKGASASGRS